MSTGRKKRAKSPKKEKETVIHRSNKLPNTNLYSAIVKAGGDKRIAAMASHKHPNMDPNKNKAYVKDHANRTYDDDMDQILANKAKEKRNNTPKKKQKK